MKTPTAATDETGARATQATSVRDYLGLTRPRLNSLTVFAVAAGWYAAVGPEGDLGSMISTAVGATLLAAGSSAVNQAMEHDRDRRMERTRDRPVAGGRLTWAQAAVFGAILALLGTLVLAVATNWLTTGLGLFCLVWYLGVYTPLKHRTSLNTLVGTVSGAIPPVMGVTAAVGTVTPVAWFLFALLVVWQLPHFLAIAWLYRRQYRRAGFVMLPGIQGGAVSTARQIVVQTVLVLVASLFATPMGLAGETYLFVALAAGVVFLGAAVQFAFQRTDAAARLLLRVSIVYLPVVLTAFALDVVVR